MAATADGSTLLSGQSSCADALPDDRDGAGDHTRHTVPLPKDSHNASTSADTIISDRASPSISGGAGCAHAPHVTQAWDWWRRFHSPRYFMAPMVGLSDLAFRILVRAHGVDVTSTDMVDAGGYSKSEQYREQYALDRSGVNRDDTPLVCQLGSGEPRDLAAAAALAAPHVDAIELNIGCPQRCAKRATPPYGAYLMDDLPRLYECVRAIAAACAPFAHVVVICKIRVFAEVHDTRTIEMCQGLQASGGQVLIVHGRTRGQGGGYKTVGSDGERLARWDIIAKCKAAVDIPCVTNGNVRHRADAEASLEATGCDAIMSGCGLLADPYLFGRDLKTCPPAGTKPEALSWSERKGLAREYLSIALTVESNYIRNYHPLKKHLQQWLCEGKMRAVADSVEEWETISQAVETYQGGEGGLAALIAALGTSA